MLTSTIARVKARINDLTLHGSGICGQCQRITPEGLSSRYIRLCPSGSLAASGQHFQNTWDWPRTHAAAAKMFNRSAVGSLHACQGAFGWRGSSQCENPEADGQPTQFIRSPSPSSGREPSARAAQLGECPLGLRGSATRCLVSLR